MTIEEGVVTLLTGEQGDLEGAAFPVGDDGPRVGPVGDGAGIPSGSSGPEVSDASDPGGAPDRATWGSRSPVEVAVAAGRDPRWEELLALAERVGPSPELAHLDDAGLERQLRVAASRLAAETCRWLELLAELVIRGVWADQGARTPAVWLSWALGIAPATARDQVRVALRLRELDGVRERFAAGRISYSKVRAITRVAVPELEATLLEWADRSTAAELEEAVRGFRRAQAGLSVEPDEPERKTGAWLVDRGDGTAELVLRLPTAEAHEAYAAAQRLADLERRAERAEQAERDIDLAKDPGAAFAEASATPGGEAACGAAPATPGGEAACGAAPATPGGEAASAEAAGQSPATSDPVRPFGAEVADAVVRVLTSAVAARPADTTGEDRHTLVVHVDEDDLAEDEGLPVAVETSTGRMPSLSRRVLRRLACDAGLVLVTTDGGGAPVDVGRRDRRLSAALRRALRLRDRHCRFPGCGTRRHLHAHHVIHWVDGGPTDLANLVLLCAFHHRYVHAHDYHVEVHPAGAHTFQRPDGRRVPRTRGLPGTDRPGTHDPATCDVRTGDALFRDSDGCADGLGYEPDALQPSYWDGHGYFDLYTTVAVLQQQLHAVLPPAALAA